MTPHADPKISKRAAEAWRDHGKLIEIGGRPNRSVRFIPIWRTTLKDGLLYFTDEDGVHHDMPEDFLDWYQWTTKSKLFKTELQRWQEFRDFQQRVQYQDPLPTAFSLARSDQPVNEILGKLNDWREYKVYQSKQIYRFGKLHKGCRQSLQGAMDREAASGKGWTPKLRSEYKRWLERMPRVRGDLKEARKLLALIREQNFQILVEASE